MPRKLTPIIIVLIPWLLRPLEVLAQATTAEPPMVQSALGLVAVTFLLPLGLMLLIGSTLPAPIVTRCLLKLLIMWAVAGLAYFFVGFALQFGGLDHANANPDFSGLDRAWYPLGLTAPTEVARLWGAVGFSGWALAGDTATPAVFLLFAVHVALLGVAGLVPISTLLRRGRVGLALLIALLMGSLIYPISGYWLWGGGWLANIGLSLGLGQGFVDFGGAGPVFLSGSIVTIIVLYKHRSDDPAPIPEPTEVVVPLTPDSSLTVYSKSEDSPLFSDQGQDSPSMAPPPPPLPSANSPMWSLLGIGLMLSGWIGLAAGVHLPLADDFNAPQAGVNGLMAALAAMVGAAGLGWVTTRSLDPWLVMRSFVAGLVAAMAGAADVSVAVMVLAGLLLGGVLPLMLRLIERRVGLVDETGLPEAVGLSAIFGLLLAGLFGGGGSGQLLAQILGLLAIFGLAVAGTLLLCRTLEVITRSWARAGWEVV